MVLSQTTNRLLLMKYCSGPVHIGMALLAIGIVTSCSTSARDRTEMDLPPIDFARSFVTFIDKDLDGKLIDEFRVQVESRCTLIDAEKGTQEEYFLTASSKAQQTFGKDNLVKLPNYDCSAIFSNKEMKYVRLFLSSRTNHPQSGALKDRGRTWGMTGDVHDAVSFHIVNAQDVAVLKERSDMVSAMLGGKPVVGRTKLTIRGAVTAIIDYPVKTFNVNRETNLFQIDTGPLLYPDRERLAMEFGIDGLD